MRIKITADSTCDLPSEIVRKYNIGIVPLYIVKNEESFRDSLEIVPKDIFDHVESGAGICHSAAVNVADYDEWFAKGLEEHDAVIHVNISHEFSSCNQNALISAAELENVYVVDSLNLSTGSGLVVLEAALLAERGMAPEQIVAELNEFTKRVEASFVIGTLKYLHKGGRCSGLAAFGANVLGLKPCIEVIDGKMGVGKKYRGNFEKIILQYVSDRLANRDDLDKKRIFVTFPPSLPQKVVDSVVGLISSEYGFEEILCSNAGCVISNHCGPTCLGVLYCRK